MFSLLLKRIISITLLNCTICLCSSNNCIGLSKSEFLILKSDCIFTNTSPYVGCGSRIFTYLNTNDSCITIKSIPDSSSWDQILMHSDSLLIKNKEEAKLLIYDLLKIFASIKLIGVISITELINSWRVELAYNRTRCDYFPIIVEKWNWKFIINENGKLLEDKKILLK